MVGTAPVRGVCPEYGDMRNEAAVRRPLDQLPRRTRTPPRRFSGRARERATIRRTPRCRRNRRRFAGVRFTVIGTMDRKIQLSNYFSSDDESTWIPYSAAKDLWNTKYANVLVFEPIAPQFEAARRGAGSRRHRHPPAILAHRQESHSDVWPRRIPPRHQRHHDRSASPAHLHRHSDARDRRRRRHEHHARLGR